MGGLLVLNKLRHCSGRGEAKGGVGGRKFGRSEMKRKGKKLERKGGGGGGGRRERNPREGEINRRRKGKWRE